jgi:ribose 5-phosphate isomerase B
MAANRFKGIRASLVWSVEEARLSRNDDDANILCLPASLIDQRTAEVVTHIWLKTPFAGAARFKRRLAELDEMG